MNLSFFKNTHSFLGTPRCAENHQKTDESGRSLIEMLGTIAIITMLTVGGITGVSYMMQAYRTNTAADDVEQAILGIQDLYSWQKDFKGLSMARICQNDVLSRDCITKTHWNNPFGGTMDATSKATSDGFIGFEISLTNVPAASCRNLVNRTWAQVSTVSVEGGSCPQGRKGIKTLTFRPY